MPFNPKDPTQLAALKSEVNVDPVSVGYSAVITETKKLLDALNSATSNPGNEKSLTPLTVSHLVSTVDFTEYGGLPVADQQYINIFLNRQLEVDLEPYRTKILAAFSTGGTTYPLLTSNKQLQSRAEVLFGSGATIQRSDWVAARDI